MAHSVFPEGKWELEGLTILQSSVWSRKNTSFSAAGLSVQKPTHIYFIQSSYSREQKLDGLRARIG